MTVLALALAFVGAATGSFVAVLVERLPHGEPVGLDRSRCVCGALVPMRRNVPVLSYLMLRGRARCCGAAIPAWYLAIEAAMGTTGLLAGIAVPGIAAVPVAVAAWAAIGGLFALRHAPARS